MAEGDGGLADEVLFRPVRSGNAFEDTVSRLLQTIRLGIVQPGEALPPERDLATRFSVSRDTVRDAIRSLAEAGYLVARRGRYGGTFVSDPLPTAPETDAPAPSAADLEDVLGLRSILEVGAARAAAARDLSAAERELLWSQSRETAAASVEDYRRLDSRLHLAIAEVVGIPSLVSLIADNRTRVNHLLDTIPLLSRNIEHSNQQHEAIVVAILTGNPERAAGEMAEHLAGSATLLRGFLS
ncbi:GntR family transcriptional repressor for pyruvate dehydrogenase complex [Microbacteriaceae bacterium SG_E_30_P1]|uniref:GntR family transcriptional repressor for pyruvate dehydrogenase complex n=1 Tax=Antiquaquibacter oligotrophicus TaxID=2880260 RepID=A0ABT6KNP5_9MICO|nr:GntR family transcriptional regulator [Antiquaquibacter oligotrophicus]MDH6181623.1 GntR family transcriptional repressor for pyruvate dehydrogenase complex [Antiquaquibacter oligotrophicus]UDF12692.1 GntR family transcriptional regulator [Antiquaquibacter oligotrophicus]